MRILNFTPATVVLDGMGDDVFQPAAAERPSDARSKVCPRRAELFGSARRFAVLPRVRLESSCNPILGDPFYPPLRGHAPRCRRVIRKCSNHFSRVGAAYASTSSVL